MKLLTIEDRSLLNQLAQDIASRANGDAWFQEKNVEERRAILRELILFILQAGPRPGDGEAAVAASKLKPTLTPCVLVAKPPLKVQLAKMLQLPTTELPRVFQLLIQLPAVADTRRRRGAARSREPLVAQGSN